MAKVKSAKQRITDYMKAKGLDSNEIREAFDELDAADADLDKLADASDKNNQWVTWYNQVTPAMQEILNERDSLKQKLAKLGEAGLSFEDAQAAVTQHAQQSSSFDHTKFQNDLTRATNTLMKDVAKYGIKHFRDFNEELDYDKVEQIMGERNIPFDVAYNLHTEPRRNEKREKEVTEKIRLGIQEGLQAEMSKQGIRKTRKRTDDVEPAPLDKPSPSDSDLKQAFLKDLEEEVTH